MREATEFNFLHFQYILDTLFASLAILAEEENLLLQEKTHVTPKKDVETFDSSQLHQAKVNVFCSSVLCLGTHEMCEATRESPTKL